MKIEDIYIGWIYQVTKENYIPGILRDYTPNCLIEYFLTSKSVIEAKTLKLALLRKKEWSYQELETRKKYNEYYFEVGDTFIIPNELIPFATALLPEEPPKNLSKRKALKKFQEIKNSKILT